MECPIAVCISLINKFSDILISYTNPTYLRRNLFAEQLINSKQITVRDKSNSNNYSTTGWQSKTVINGVTVSRLHNAWGRMKIVPLEREGPGCERAAREDKSGTKRTKTLICSLMIFLRCLKHYLLVHSIFCFRVKCHWHALCLNETKFKNSYLYIYF